MLGRGAPGLVALLLLFAACGDGATQQENLDDQETTVPSTSSRDSSTTEDTKPVVDLASVVLASEAALPGMSPVPGESGAVTADILPPGAQLRVLLDGFGVLDGHATVFAGDDGGETVVVAAIRFSTSQGAADAFVEFENIRSDIDSATGPVVFAVTGDPLLGSCASIDLLELADSVITVWLNTSACHGIDAEAPTSELLCPAELAVDEAAEVTVVVPSHYEPLTWQTDSDHLFWIEGYQLILGEQTETGQEVHMLVTVTDEFSVEGTFADLKAVFTTFSDIEAFGGTYRLGGPRVEAECTIAIVAPASS